MSLSGKYVNYSKLYKELDGDEEILVQQVTAYVGRNQC